MFISFVREINIFLPKVFDRALSMADMLTPPKTKVIIAGENFPDRVKAIMSGSFSERIKRVNVEVSLDTSTEADQSLKKQLVAQILMKGGMAPLSGFREMGIFREPERLTREMEEWTMLQNEAQKYAILAKKYPPLAETYKAVTEKFVTALEQGQALLESNSQVRQD